MSKRKTTKRSLVSSVISLIICVSMLVGTTLAWFTDSVSSGVNRIQAGNLDVDVMHTSASVTTETSINNETNLFRDVNGGAMLWEPGAVSYENFTVKNLGTLALKYNMKLNITDYNAVSDTNKTLKDVLKVMILTEDHILNTVDRTSVADLDWGNATSLDQFTKSNAALYPAGGNQNSTEKFQVIVYWQPGENDNEWNVNNGKTTTDGEPLFIEFGINLVASQYQSENDSFGSDYDQGIVLPDLPVSINKTFQSEPITKESVNEDVQVKNASMTESVAVVPAASVNVVLNQLLSQANDRKDDSDISTVIYLDVTTGEKTESTVTYNINMSAKMTYTNNSNKTVTTELSNLDGYLADEIVTARVEVGEGLSNVTVKHNELSMNSLSSESENSEGFYYNKQTGMLTIKSTSFSPFTIAYSLDAVAVIGETPYGTLSEAVAAAKENDVILLTKDIDEDNIEIDVDQNITLNLNGKTISGITDAKDAYVIKNNGTLVINGNNGAIKAKAIAVLNCGTLTVNGGSYSNTSANASYIFDTKAGSTTIDGVILTAAVKGIRADGANANVVVKDSTADVTPSYGLFAVGDSGTLTVESGTYKTTYTKQQQMFDLKEKGKITVKGGKFETIYEGTDGSIPAMVVFNTNDQNTMDIQGGTFTYAGDLIYFHNNNNNTVTITGGTFSKDPSTYKKVGYRVEMDGTNYVVLECSSHDIEGVDGSCSKCGYKELVYGANSCKNTAIPEGTVFISTQDALDSAISSAYASGENIIYIDAGTYSISNVNANGKTIKFVGKGFDKTTLKYGTKPASNAAEAGSNYNFENANITFTDVKLEDVNGNDTDYKGFVRAQSIEFNNCVLKSRITYLGSGDVTFNSCTFDTPKYALWLYGSQTYNFNNCYSESATGRFFNIYSETSIKPVVNVKDCKFVDTSTDGDSKAVFNIKSNAKTKLSILNSKFEGNSPIYKVESANGTTVTIDGKQVYPISN